MIFDTAEAKCIISVLKILEKDKSKYSIMFKETKFSHITLQKVLKNLEENKLINREILGHLNINYKISDKGKKLLKKLLEIKEILK
jgi:DNA-binding PadR family transcriptional regulator